MSSISPARKTAFSILKTMEKHGHSDELLRGRNVDILSEADRKLTTALVLGTLRWQIDLDRRIRPLLKHPNAKLDTEVRIALRLGAFQLLHLDRIPTRAVIDESVELAKRAGHRFASGMVNAVLRKLAASQTEQDDLEATDGREAHPAWMVERWSGFYGDEATRTICRYGQQQPTLSVRVSADVVEKEIAASWVGSEVAFGPGEFLQDAQRVISGDVVSASAFREGQLRIQDEGSQVIAELLPRGQSILDCCAAPGGKTLILGERNPDAEIVACDESDQRLAELKKRLAVLGERVQCRLADVTRLTDASAFDIVLADVPCSGTGTLGRNPEIRHRLRLEDLHRQAERQKALLRSALQDVRPGGHVLYSTCSMEPEENEQVIAACVPAVSEFRIIPVRTELQRLQESRELVWKNMDELISGDFLRTIPGVHPCDGFFAAILDKD